MKKAILERPMSRNHVDVIIAYEDGSAVEQSTYGLYFSMFNWKEFGHKSLEAYANHMTQHGYRIAEIQ
jgi:hypothetical protein